MMHATRSFDLKRNVSLDMVPSMGMFTLAVQAASRHSTLRLSLGRMLAVKLL
jgi:hypothetical protein